MLRSSLLASVAVSPFLLSSALAQDSFDLGTIVFSSNLSPIEEGRTGATVEVLEGAQTGMQDNSVIARLTRLPGVNSTSNGGLGASTSIAIRGLTSRYVGVRINGIDVADPASTQTQFNFGGLTAAGIDRIEVLKGSQSALYGSEAIGGVVNISTFRPTEDGFSGRYNVETGSFNTHSANLAIGHKSERGEIALTYGRVTTDGISAQSFNDEEDGFSQTTATLTGQFEATDNLTLGASFFYRDRDTEIDRSSFSNDASGEIFSKERGARVFATLQTGIVTHTLSYSSFDIGRDDPGGFTDRFDGERRELAYLGSADLGRGMVLNFGIDRTDEDFSNTNVSGSEDTTSIKAELLASLSDQLDVSAALRYDDNSDFGGKTTGRVAAVYRPREDLAFRAVVGTGFRTPSLFERYSDYGVSSLQPEKSLSFELGVEKTYARGVVKATLFHTDIDDLIDFDGAATACGGPFGCYNQVPGTTTSKGVELSGDYAVSDRVSVYGSYTYTDAKTDGVRLTRAPRHDAVFGVEAAITDRFSAYADVRHVGDIMPSAFAPAGHKVDDYTLVGIGASYGVSDTADLYVRIENLFDEDYETAGGYNQPGRAAYFGISAKF